MIRDLASATGKVTEYLKTANSDGGHDYEVRYEFRAENGDSCRGGSGSTMKELPEKDGPIQVLYNRQDPTRNMPREIFWFYRF